MRIVRLGPTFQTDRQIEAERQTETETQRDGETDGETERRRGRGREKDRGEKESVREKTKTCLQALIYETTNYSDLCLLLKSRPNFKK